MATVCLWHSLFSHCVLHLIMCRTEDLECDHVYYCNNSVSWSSSIFIYIYSRSVELFSSMLRFFVLLFLFIHSTLDNHQNCSKCYESGTAPITSVISICMRVCVWLFLQSENNSSSAQNQCVTFKCPVSFAHASILDSLAFLSTLLIRFSSSLFFLRLRFLSVCLLCRLSCDLK